MRRHKYGKRHGGALGATGFNLVLVVALGLALGMKGMDYAIGKGWV